MDEYDEALINERIAAELDRFDSDLEEFGNPYTEEA